MKKAIIFASIIFLLLIPGAIANATKISHPLTVSVEPTEVIYNTNLKYPRAEYPIITWEDLSAPEEGVYTVTITNIPAATCQSLGCHPSETLKKYYEHIEYANGDEAYQINPNYPIGGELFVDAPATTHHTVLVEKLTKGEFQVNVVYSNVDYIYGSSTTFTVTDGRSTFSKALESIRKNAINILDAPREVITKGLLLVFYPSHYRAMYYPHAEPTYPVDTYPMFMPTWVVVFGIVLGYGMWIAIAALTVYVVVLKKRR